MLDRSPIPLVDLKANSASIKSDVMEAIGHVIDSAGFVLGNAVTQFEQEFADYCSTRHAIGVANGTEAIHMALRALGIGMGDEVITAGNSFAATPFAIAYAGAQPVFVDIDESDFNLNVDLLEQAITPNTKAILPVHLYGQCARMNEICEIADRHGLHIVEDAAQAHGAEYDGRRAGSFGDVGCFSFYPGKNLGAFGDGGAVVTNDDQLAERLRLLRNYGQVRKNEHGMLGYNCRLDSIQAAVLSVKMQHIEAWTDSRRMAAEQYNALLSELGIVCPRERAGARHVYHLYVVRHPARDELIRRMANKKIACGIHYPHPLHRAAPFRNARTVPNGLPVCTQITSEIMSLPMFPELKESEIRRICDELAVAIRETEEFCDVSPEVA